MYDEVQQVGNAAATRRRSTVTFLDTEATPHGLGWLVVHEAWVS